ncbi:MAG: hypothetical protein PHC84_00265 [Clostridia bacterium]|nr:hypothetical protein [Clostridia bacterium]
MLREKHEFFKMIKKRLVENNYSDYTVKINDERVGEVYFLNNKRMTSEQIRVLSVKVSEIIKSDDFILDPLTKLIIDKDEFMSLDEIAKQRYILDLSSIYIDIKKKTINS